MIQISLFSEVLVYSNSCKFFSKDLLEDLGDYALTHTLKDSPPMLYLTKGLS